MCRNTSSGTRLPSGKLSTPVSRQWSRTSSAWWVIGASSAAAAASFSMRYLIPLRFMAVVSSLTASYLHLILRQIQPKHPIVRAGRRRPRPLFEPTLYGVVGRERLFFDDGYM